MFKLFFLRVTDPQKYSKEFTVDILSKELGIHRNKLSISIDQYGKPYLRGYTNFHFNVSHSKDAIVCGVSDNPIGVDIEKIKQLNSSIIDRFFTQNEREYIYSVNDKQGERFIEIWTKKEAYVKWIGKGMEIPFNSFDVLNDTRIRTRYIDDYVLSICSNNISNNVEIDLIRVKN